MSSSTIRTREQIVIDALELELKRLSKKADRYRKQLDIPMLEILELQREIPQKLAKLKQGTSEFAKYVEDSTAKLKKLRKEQEQYEKRDTIEVARREAEARCEMVTIKSLIAVYRMRGV